MTTSLRVGLLGCSSVARRKTLPALRSANARVTAVAARSPERAAAVADPLGAAVRGYHDLVTGDDVDAVYVSLPNASHFEWTRRALLAGKHVLCEKPLTTTAAQTRELVAIAARQGLVLRENFTFPYHPQHAEVRAMLDAGRVGPLRTFAATFRIPPLPGGDIRYQPGLGGGSLLDAGVYPLRAARLLLGRGLTVDGAALRVDKTRDVDVAGHVLLVSPDGVFASLEFGFQHGYRSRYTYSGGSGSITLDRAFTPPPTWRPVVLVEEQDRREELTLPAADQFALAVDSFATAALRGPDPAVEAEAGDLSTDTARLVDEVLTSAVRVPDQPTHQEVGS
ncbi:Gfo/Idh/MocA family oxidoreductase [Actinokineospora auranticolor]|uniref:Putative dehydrogenase n=1 Tax=Actinokineospora auranticolor TaxID=155976 RepID=A0A2S6GTC7_9PSEU|nr:Gfo/Idh/MocA family oxidoreductase [Actinokineospora auranticolor]PPK68508.1 putative dehydrogenase [Actinokineospora auranticolor]